MALTGVAVRHLFIDDESWRGQAMIELCPSGSIAWATSETEAMDALRDERFGIVFLDYNLDQDTTTENIALHIATMEQRPFVVIHTMDGDGAERLREILPDARACAFPNLLEAIRFAQDALDDATELWSYLRRSISYW